LDVSTGIKEYQEGKGKPPQTKKDKDNLKFNANNKIDKSYIPELRGKNIDRYSCSWKNEYIKYGEWLAEPRKYKYFQGKRILLRKIPSRNNLIAFLTNDEYIIDQSIYIAKEINNKNNILYILSLLNSKLIGWYFKNKNQQFDDLFPQIKINQFKDLPIFMVNPDNIKEKYKHDELVKCAHEMLKLNKILHKEKEGTNSRKRIKSEIEKTDKLIDQKVYDLYGLNKKEIEVVEKNI
jgi:adenine-specific DNA-methyltransferase